MSYNDEYLKTLAKYNPVPLQSKVILNEKSEIRFRSTADWSENEIRERFAKLKELILSGKEKKTDLDF